MPTPAPASANQAAPASISVHKGMKIQAALCAERPPLALHEPDFKRKWRAFCEAWERRTNNSLTIEDEIVYMRFHFHFLDDRSASKALGGGGGPAQVGGKTPRGPGAGDGDAGGGDVVARQDGQVGNLDALLAEEGLDIAFPDAGRRTTRRRKAERRQAEVVDDANVRSVRRLSTQSLFLLVRYGGASSWTFPKINRAHGESMRDTLLQLCGSQLGQKFAPYLVGACPFAHRKRRGSQNLGIEGRKIFYYRARLLPEMDVALPSGSPVADWAWCSRGELPQYLTEGEWFAVRDGLPLNVGDA